MLQLTSHLQLDSSNLHNIMVHLFGEKLADQLLGKETMVWVQNGTHNVFCNCWWGWGVKVWGAMRQGDGYRVHYTLLHPSEEDGCLECVLANNNLIQDDMWWNRMDLFSLPPPKKDEILP
jgi:hypothetical protein